MLLRSQSEANGVRLLSVAVWLPLAISLTVTVALPLANFVLVGLTYNPGADYPIVNVLGQRDTASTIGRTALLAILCTFAQFGIGLRIGIVTSRVWRQRAPIALLALPLLAGPAICAVLWKAILDPFNGLPASLARLVGASSLDWTASELSAFVVVAGVQIWIWALAAGAAIATLFDPLVRQAREIYLLDGGPAALADMWSLWVTRQRWVVLIALALFVENLRAFETIFVLTRGGPGTATVTLQWKIFETSYVLAHNGDAAAWVILLLVVFQIGLLPFGLWMRRNGSYT